MSSRRVVDNARFDFTGVWPRLHTPATEPKAKTA